MVAKTYKKAHFDNEDNNNKTAPDPCGSELDHPPAYPNSPNSFDSDSSDSEGDSDSGSSSGELPWELSYYRPPTVAQAQTALATLDSARRTQLPSGGYKYKDLDRITAERYTAIQACLNQFLEAEPKGKKFIQASKDAARMHNRRDTYAQTIRKWTRRLINYGDLPGNIRGWWNVSTLEDEDVSSAIRLHLQKAGKLAGAQDVVDFLSDPEVRKTLDIKKKISLRTAQRWLSRAGFSWRSEPVGQYFDGHERQDVVEYRQKVYIPFLKKIERRRIIYNRDGVEDPTRPLRLLPGEKPIIFSMGLCWRKPSTTQERRGCSLMVADFVCAEFGWLRGPNGNNVSRGDKDGWFTNDRVILQLEDAVKIVNEHFPQFTHIFVYDNAPSHTKRSLSSLSAYGMPKGPLLDWPYYKDKDDKRVFVRMENGFLPDGSPRSSMTQTNPIVSRECRGFFESASRSSCRFERSLHEGM
ncbi:hypothetical protein RHS01_11078 [Rhizoctonia solani]|uniref:Uncharacterized protein n=1 Tax=Rhizoctonia solani TaxID=456999 RepID=A0A8H7LWN5_9AGAM|nr:hypothetical protein RHS01_11078 [Rhizoctonia solani]